MKDRFDEKGQLIIPLKGIVKLSKDKVNKKEGKFIVNEAYCSQGHDLMSDIKIDNYPGIHFVYTDKNADRESEIIISPFVGKCKKNIIKGKAFEKGEIVKILCPACRIELPVLFNCHCGAPIYLFYIDKSLNHYIGQSLCSRVGCVKASQLRFSKDALSEFISHYSF